MTDRLAKATPTHHPLLKLSRYEHGGGRLFIDGESGARELIADFYSEGNREFYSQAFADVEWLLAECDTLRAQLAEQKAATFTSERFRREDAMSHIRDLGDMYTRAQAAEAQLAKLTRETTRGDR